MTAKIDWYREVLELEPNSKVFFPLARLLADAGERDEAMALLERGLERHPEYLEARLFRIELLFQDGRKEECNAEIARLSRMFASYAGFWQAWAACLASEQGQSDTASLIRFLAAHFVSGPLQLHEVLNRGLDAMIKERQGEAQPALQAESAAPAEEQATEPDSGSAEAAVNAQEESDAPAETAEDAAAATFMSDTAAMLADLDSELGDQAMADSRAATQVPQVEEPAQAMDAPEAQRLEDGSGEEAAGPALATPAQAVAVELDEMPVEVAGEGLAEAAELGIEPDAPDSLSDMTQAAEDSLPDATLPAVEESSMDLPETLADAAASVEADALEAPGQKTAAEPVLTEPDLEADMEAVLAEPVPDAGPVVQAVEVEQEASAEAAEAEPETACVIRQAAAREAAPDVIEPEIAAQLSEPEVDFLMETPAKNGPAPATLAEAEADMVNGLDLPAMEAPVQEAAPAEAEQAEEPEEPFSLRTRSMAEVLAEQGDIQGALDIYEELAAAATSGDEIEDINRRVATLRGRLTVANASANFNAAEEASAAQNKEKLISMLEALAQRVEARAQ